MPNGNGSNGVGAEADATAQRKRGAQSDVFGAPRVRIYPPCPGAAQRGVSVRFVPEPAPGAQSTGRLSAARAGSGGRGAHSLVRCSGGGYVTPAAVQRGTHRGAKLGCVFANGGQCNENRHRNATLPRIRGIAHRLREVRFPLKGYGNAKKHAVHVCILC
jgi:hypothetical protein